MRLSSKAVALVAALTALLCVTAAPVAAAEPDGAYARFAGNIRGLVLLSYSGTTPPVNADLLGLISSAEYFLRGHSIGCNGTPTRANRVFRVRGMTDANGALDIRRSPDIDRIVRSIWLVPTDGGTPPTCQVSLNFEEIKIVGDWDSDGATGAAELKAGASEVLMETITMVERRPNGRARISIVVDPRDPSGNTISLRGVNQPCGSPAPNTSWRVTFQDLMVTSYKTTTVEMSQNQLDALRSVRVRDQTTGQNLGCVPLSIIAVLIG